MTTRVQIGNVDTGHTKRLSVKVWFPDDVNGIPTQWYHLEPGLTHIQTIHSGARVEIEEVD